MSQHQKQQPKPIEQPTISREAAQEIRHQPQYQPDPADQMTMMLTMGMTFLMKLDPIFLWGAWFFMISLAINRGKMGSIFSQSLIVSVMLLIFIGLTYWNIARGARPPPSKWTLF
ncbi:hypothetical protein TVAG_364580 [Trichomonas vaginalis G3]|uniref:Uncharacterized protein n=1 Tax=Trichomonas vaginalis (strain ATCC PRA-98 / G3) TaxID=412133 RepID=A2E9G9_TRIV3|nr:hypothetical protein TVAGG3_0001110 [Trichomonas vaginalis G3]EAY10733.1 hypothetical protein TVAG_364580 [Trichomonas vaginalis G3]KAI5538626.1 hypothetical protein TVAGG3_0001110 [Trichomonas vaginalis G3]|eukprot:XP_001322956.1 hypothetical protein [Trichomonas vaginalis G3]